MLKLISFKDITKNGDLYYGQYRLRYREFIDRQQYDVRTLDGHEFDEYDHLAAKYIVYSEDNKTVLGCSRLTPLEYGCMLADHFPDLVDDKSVFQAPRVWEGTRFCVDSRLPPEKRLHVLRCIVAGYIEFGLHNGLDRIIGLMQTGILRSVWERSGVTLERLGPVMKVGAHTRVQAAAIPIHRTQWENMVAMTGVPHALEWPQLALVKHAG
jgi:acyl homoserine lactone synthase